MADKQKRELITRIVDAVEELARDTVHNESNLGNEWANQFDDGWQNLFKALEELLDD